MTITYEAGASLHRAVRKNMRSSHEVIRGICMLYLLESSQKPETTPGFSNRVDLMQRIDNKGNGSAEKLKGTQGGNLRRNKSRYLLLSRGMEGPQWVLRDLRGRTVLLDPRRRCSQQGAC